MTRNTAITSADGGLLIADRKNVRKESPPLDICFLREYTDKKFPKEYDDDPLYRFCEYCRYAVRQRNFSLYRAYIVAP